MLLTSAWMRFKGDGCAYSDDKTWFTKELIAYNRNAGFLSGSGIANDLVTLIYNEHKNGGGCKFKAGPWALFETTFVFGHDYLHFDWWNSELRTHEIFKLSGRFTATTNSNPTNSVVNWISLKTDFNDNLCWDVNGGKTHNGNHVWLWNCKSANSQKFYMDSLGRIRSKLDTNKCLEAGTGVDLYAKMFIWDCHDGLWQQWEMTSDRKIRSKKNGRYIGVSGGCNGVSKRGRLEMQDGYSSGNCKRQQQWLDWPPIYRDIESDLDRDLCWDVNGGKTHNGNHVWLWNCKSANSQKFYMDSLGRIRSKLDTNKCLEAGTGVDLYAKMFIWDCHDGLWQQWEMTSDRKIRSKKNGRYIGVSGGCNGVSKRGRLEMHDEFSGTGDCARQQKWHFSGYY